MELRPDFYCMPEIFHLIQAHAPPWCIDFCLYELAGETVGIARAVVSM